MLNLCGNVGDCTVRVWVWAMAAVVLLIGTSAIAQQVERTETPSWVRPIASDLPQAPSDDAAIRMLAIDRQVRITPQGRDMFMHRSIRIQSPQGLDLMSTISASWAPPRQSIQVHAVNIIRGGATIDVLAEQEFEVLRRENNLSYSMLDGVLTATLQPRDLRVGDILETAFTIRDDGGILAPHQELLDEQTNGWPIDYARYRVEWPAGLDLRSKLPDAWTQVQPRRTPDGWEVLIERTAVQPARLPDDLPSRYYLQNIIQFTDAADWAQVSAMVAPLYAQAEILDTDSPLKAEIERIRSAHATPEERAAAALRLVQDQVRYLALSMGEGGYVPQAADAVWRSRYGDCKGKTVLLLALLHGLGIEAEPALVSTDYGDGLDLRLPLMAWFDHILVKATIDGRDYWMDGTRVGDRQLALLTPPPYRWALPVQAEGGALTPIVVPLAVRAAEDTFITIDASNGLDAPTAFVLDMSYTGDTAITTRERFARVTAEQLHTIFEARFAEQKSTKFEKVETRYDEADNVFHIVITGTSQLAWVAGSGGRLLGVDGTVIAIPTQVERTGLFADLKDEPYSVGYPAMGRTRTRITLPNGGQGFRLEGGDMDVSAGGYRQQRTATITDGVAEVLVTWTSLAPEISAADMETARTRRESLNDVGARIRAPADYAGTDADRARLEPGDSDIEDLLERAETLTTNADIEGALALLDAAVERDPDNLKVRLARGDARLADDNVSGAREDFDHAVDLDPADIKAVLGQGWAAYRDGRASEAVVSYSVALRLDPGNDEALHGRALSYYQLGRTERSLDDYRTLKSSAPESNAGATGELRALARLGRGAEARTIIDERLAETPTDAVALYARQALATRENQPAEALPALDAAITVSPEDRGLRISRGQARALAGEADGAHEDFTMVRAGANGDPQWLNNLCWSQGLSGFDLTTALADCDAAIAAAPEAAFLDSRAMVLLQMERFDEAKRDYDTALEGQPYQSASLFGRGLARIALGDPEGRVDIDRARALDIDVGDDFAVFLARHPELVP